MKNSVKNKYVYSGCRIIFDGAVSLNFGNSFTRNDVIFGIDKSSSSDVGNRKNNFLVLCDRSADDINGSVSATEKKFSINFGKAKTNICLSLHCNGDKSYLFANGKDICKFKSDNKYANSSTQNHV